MNPQMLFAGGFLVTVGTISYFEIKQCGDLPWPPRIVATGATFALLELFSFFSPELSAVTAVGMTLALIIGMLSPSVKDRKLSTNIDCEHAASHCNCTAQAVDMQTIPNSAGPVIAT